MGRGGAPSRDQRPQYGWSRSTLIQAVDLGEPGGLTPSETSAASRPNGMLRGALYAFVAGADSAGTGEFGVILEGSQTGGAAAAEWTELASTNMQELFQAGSVSDQSITLGLSPGANLGEGFIGEGQISFGRWRYLRVRTYVDNEDALDPVTFTVSVRLAGVAGDGSTDLQSDSLVRTSGDTTEPASDVLVRPEGVRYISAQIVIDEMILIGGTDGFNFLLQGAVNQSAAAAGQWSTLNELGPFTAANQNGFFVNGQVRLIDLGGFNVYRIVAEKYDNGSPPGNNSSFTATYYITHDDNDWLDGEVGISNLNQAIQQAFVMVIGGLVVDAAPNFTVTFQVADMNQIPIRGVRRFGLLLADSQFGGILDLSAAATFTGATTGSIAFGTGTNQAVVTTDENGVAVVTIAAGAANPLFVYASQVHIPTIPSFNVFGPGQIVIASNRLQLV